MPDILYTSQRAGRCPPNCLFPWELGPHRNMVHWSHLSYWPKPHLDRFCCFHGCDQQTHRHTHRPRNIGNDRIHLLLYIAALPPDQVMCALLNVLGVYLKRTCSRVTSASSALGVFNDYTLHKSTHSLSLTQWWHWRYSPSRLAVTPRTDIE